MATGLDRTETSISSILRRNENKETEGRDGEDCHNHLMIKDIDEF